MADTDGPSRRQVLAGGATALAAMAGCLQQDDDGGPPEKLDPTGGFEIETVADGFSNPWGLAFLPDSGLLVTEREREGAGRLSLVDRETGDRETVAGVPDVFTAGQGGMLDVTTHPSFPDDAWVYLTYSAANADGESATQVGRGRLDRGEPRLDSFETLHTAEPFVDSDAHFGSRAVFGPDGRLYVTTGDRQFKDFDPDHVSQDRSNDLGATLRLAPDGSIPPDNPFVDEAGASDAIYSYGHRNSQGMTVHPETGELWQSEHGEQDGDEINVIEAGGNYGWPVAHTGCTYGSDDPVGDRPEDRADVVNPVHYWECNTGGFPPAGATFYDGEAFPDWRGDLLVGGLASRYLARFDVDGHDVEEIGPLLVDENWRIRDVAVAPDTGYLYVAVDDANAPVVRLVPA